MTKLNSFRPSALGVFLFGAFLTSSVFAGDDPLGRFPRNRTSQPQARPAPAERGTDGAGAKIATRSAEKKTEADAERQTGLSAGDQGDEGAGGQAVGQADGSYRLGPRDALQLEVWNRAEVEYERRAAVVTNEGTIFVPLLDDVKVEGMTVTEAIAHLTELYNACCIIKPAVYLEITEYNSRQVTVTGEVKSPGRYSLKGQALLTEVLAEAGDLTENASRIVRLIRGAEGDDQPQVWNINLNKINSGDPRENLSIEPGDVIIALINKNIVYISGMVKTEGYVDWEEGMTALEAVILAGGLAEGSAAGRTKIFRDKGAAGTQEIKIDLKKRKERFALLPGDIMYVPASWF